MDERILVSVRLRPLNDQEIANNDVVDWECINHHTILYRNTLPNHSHHPTAYTFDRIFQGSCTTKKVYEEAAKTVALSVLSGINSTIFAYGQTSSGKTYTMNGITEHAIADIFDYIQKHEERAYVLKFSAMEIYNEAVRDLLSRDGSPLRLLDDPEKGTVVEKLTEETLRDWNHTRQLLSICEAQRQIGETLLNQASSRSHQILRLAVESSAREFLGRDNSSTLTAVVNFVDLAGSERGYQALSAGTRLKEGSHINRSLLTLGTVIRKLSNGRNGHVPFRDSKLTRILQPSLGGNARTAVVCTVSPARSHVEQTRNTLLFASCAKEVATHAHVNVVMSDKALVKHLQRELARLESELRGPMPIATTSNTAAMLREKDRQIEKMEDKLKELRQELDVTQSQLDEFLKVVGDDKTLRLVEAFDQPPRSSPRITCEEDSSFSGLSGPDLALGCKENTQGNREILEDECKEVRCIDKGETRKNKDAELHSSLRAESEGLATGNGDAIRVQSLVLKQKLLDVQKPIGSLVNPYPQKLHQSSAEPYLSISRSLQLTKSNSNEEMPMTSTYSWFQEGDQNVKTPPNEIEMDFPGRPNSLQKTFHLLRFDLNNERSPVDDLSPSKQSSLNEMKEEDTITSGEGNVASTTTYVTGMKEITKLQQEDQLIDQGREIGVMSNESGTHLKDVGLDPGNDFFNSPLHWSLEFQRQQMEIIKLWDACHVSLVHRTYFFLLFNGDPWDSVYIEVELRRLSFLRDTFYQGHPDIVCLEDGRVITLASSMRALHRERKMLSKRMRKTLSVKERESLYQKWGIRLDTNRKRVQLVQRLWSNTEVMDHILESASIIAKLVGFPGQSFKEMFGLSFISTNQRSHGWKQRISSLIMKG